MPAASYPCPKCNSPLGIDPGTVELTSSCPRCAAPIEAYFFPPFYRAPEVGAMPAALVDHTDANCFYHPQKQAAQVCDGCGRLICSLCSVELASEHLCPNCISSGKKKGKLTSLENQRTRYDSVALSLAIFSIFVYFLSIFLAPAAIYVAIRHWKTPGSLLGVKRYRFVIALILASLSLLVWPLFAWALFFHPHKY